VLSDVRPGVFTPYPLRLYRSLVFRNHAFISALSSIGLKTGTVTRVACVTRVPGRYRMGQMWALLTSKALLLFFLVQLVRGESFSALASMDMEDPTFNFGARYLTPIDCYRGLFPNELDNLVLAFDIVEARLAIHKAIGLLDQFYAATNQGLLERDCLLPFRKFMMSDYNLANLQSCNQNLFTQTIQPLSNKLQSITAQLSCLIQEN